MHCFDAEPVRHNPSTMAQCRMTEWPPMGTVHGSSMYLVGHSRTENCPHHEHAPYGAVLTCCASHLARGRMLASVHAKWHSLSAAHAHSVLRAELEEPARWRDLRSSVISSSGVLIFTAHRRLCRSTPREERAAGADRTRVLAMEGDSGHALRSYVPLSMEVDKYENKLSKLRSRERLGVSGRPSSHRN